MTTERFGTYSIDAVRMSRRRVGAENTGYGHISSFLYRAASIFFTTPLPACDAHEGQAITSSCFEKICHWLENPPAFVLIDQPPFPFISRLR